MIVCEKRYIPKEFVLESSFIFSKWLTGGL